MNAAVIFSRRKMCSNVRRTDVVPAPDEPVTEMIGCVTDMRSTPEEPAAPEERRAFANGVGVEVITIETRDFLAGSEQQRYALMKRGRRNIEDTLRARRRGATGLLDEPGNRVGFVDQPQAPVLIAVPQIARIHIDPAAGEHAMRFGDHRRKPAHVEVFAARAVRTLEAIVDVDADGLVPVPVVRSIDRELACSGRHAHVLRSESELATAAIEGEDVRALTDGD